MFSLESDVDVGEEQLVLVEWIDSNGDRCSAGAEIVIVTPAPRSAFEQAIARLKWYVQIGLKQLVAIERVNSEVAGPTGSK